MTGRLIKIYDHPSAAARAKTFRALAKARHAEAVRELELGNRDGWWSRLRDVSAIEDKAREIERHLEQIETCRAETVAAIESVLRRGRAS
jgi:hypothetical protein